MIDYYSELLKDVRFEEGLKACINCGTCTAICPAASFYYYEPRTLLNIIQKKDNTEIEELLKSDYIWYCGECMSCKTRCPRGNVPGLIIMALRALSINTGLFIESEKGRQQFYLKRTIAEWTLKRGYCLYLKGVGTENHPEQGPVWDWFQKNYEEIMEKSGANFNNEGAGILRKIPQEALDELKSIFEVTGGLKRLEIIENKSIEYAKNNGFPEDDNFDSYMKHILKYNNQKHSRL